MKTKATPYIFLVLLIIVLIFILGVRYGQKVEKTNIAVNLSLTPTTTPKATPTMVPIDFTTYVHDQCGVQFDYPTTMKVSEESSTSAQLKDNNNTIELSCDKTNEIKTVLDKIKTASPSAIKNDSNHGIAYNIYRKDSNLYLMVKNTAKNNIVYLLLTNRLERLVLNSLELAN